MKNIHYSLIGILLLLTTSSLCGQTRLAEDFIATQREIFEEDDIIISSMDIEYEFSYDKLTKKVQVQEDGTIKYVNLTNLGKEAIVPFFGDIYSVLTKLKKNNVKQYIRPRPYDSNGIFHSDANLFVLEAYIKAADVSTDVEYRYEYSDSKYLTRVQLSRPYPIKSGEVRFRFPSDMDIEVPSFNADGLSIVRSDSEEKGDKIITYTISDLPAYGSEGQSSGSAFYKPHLVVLTRAVTTSEGPKRLLSDAGDLYKWYSSLVKEIGNEPGDMQQTAADIVAGCETKECEMKRIFYWVQDNIRYIAFEDGIAGFRPEACQDVYANRYGDCKGMANLMSELLKTRDIDARLTWIGTTSIPYDYGLPSLAVDNHMICTVVEDGKYIFLDGTEKFITYGDIAERIQGRQAMVENGEGYEIVEVPHFDFDRNTEVTDISYAIKDGELIGTLDYTVKGEGKVRMMNQYRRFKQKEKGDAKSMFFSKGDPDMSIELRATTELDDREAEVEWGADFRAKNKVNAFGDELYLDWDIYKPYGGSYYNDEDLEKLKGDLDFGAKVHDIERYTIANVDGYTLKSTPENFERTTEHFSISVDFDQRSDGGIDVTKEIIIPNARIPNEGLGDWNEAIKDLKKNLYETPIIYTNAP